MAGTSAPAQADPEPAAKAAPTATAFPAPKDPDAPLRAALAEAKKQNKPVAVEEIYTEASRTWAHPDGHLTTESYAGPSQLKQPDGTWAWLDSTLVEQDGVLKPKLAKAKMAFSAGGDAPFASMERAAGQRFALTWPTKLPKPTINGNVAEYRDAAGPGADLVVTALPTGFRHDVVLRERPAGPVEYRIPVETSGLSFAERKNGGLRLSDAKGKVVAEAPEPVMWDSSGTSPQTGGPRQATIPTDVVKENGQSVLVLKPDPAWLSDPATTFPVVVDPTSTITVTTDTVLSSLCVNAWDKPGSTTLKVGGQRASCGTADGFDYSRSYLKFDVSSFTNKPVHSASLQLFKSNHLACHLRGEGSGKGVIYAGYMQDSWTPGRMQWPNKPANTIELTSSVWASATTQTMSWPVTNWVKRWAGGAPNSGIELRGTTESLVNNWDSYWAEFHSAEMTGTEANPPKLIVNYFLPPEIPTVTAESVDSLDGDHAIVRTKSVKIGYKSASVDGRNIDYYASVIDSTAPMPTWTTGGGATGQWSFNEFTYGTDSSGKGNPLVFPLGTSSEIDGKQGKGLLLTPTGGNLAFGSTQRPAVDTGKSYSVAGWVRLDSLTNSADLFSQDGTRNSAMIVGYDSAARKWTLEAYRADTDGSAASRVASTSAAQAGVWAHVAGVYDTAAKKVRLYVNGALAGESDHTATPWKATGSFNLNLGLRAGFVMSTRKVSYDEVRVYDRALNETEVKWMTSLTPPTNANLPSGQAASLTYDVGNVDYFRISIRACLTGVNPPTCNESPYYRISTDAPLLPTDTETGTADPMRPILSGMVNRPSGGTLTAKYYLYDGNDVPVGAVPLGTRTVKGGERASFQIPADTVRPGGTYKWQMTACASGETATDEICTSKTAPVSFTVPGTPPPPAVEDLRHLTLGKDNFVIKTAKTDPTACDGAPCPLTDSTALRIGGAGTDQVAGVIGLRLDEVPDGAVFTDATLNLGTPECSAGTCVPETVVKVAALKSAVTGSTRGSDLAADVDPEQVYDFPITAPEGDIADSAAMWYMITSTRDEVIDLGGTAAAEQISLTLTYLMPGPPSKVLDLSAQGGDAGAIASWGIPESNGSLALLDGYDVEVLDGDGASVKTLEVKDPWVAITGLSNDVTYTVRVRAKTAVGVGEWEATSFTTKALPPPPSPNTTGASMDCIPPLDGGRAAAPRGTTQATSGESRTQAYLDRVKHFIQAQDAVLEGRAATVWDAPGVQPTSPNTAGLSLLNAALLSQREVMAQNGESRSGSTVTLDDAVVYPGRDGSVYVTAKVDRTWTVNSTSSSTATPTARAGSTKATAAGGMVEGIPPTITIFVLGPYCGVKTIDVPIDSYMDQSDQIDPEGLDSCASAANSAAAGAATRAQLLDDSACDAGKIGSNSRGCVITHPGGKSDLTFASPGDTYRIWETDVIPENGDGTVVKTKLQCDVKNLLPGAKGWYWTTRTTAIWRPTEKRGSLGPQMQWKLDSLRNQVFLTSANKTYGVAYHTNGTIDWAKSSKFAKVLLLDKTPGGKNNGPGAVVKASSKACFRWEKESSSYEARLVVGGTFGAPDGKITGEFNVGGEWAKLLSGTTDKDCGSFNPTRRLERKAIFDDSSEDAELGGQCWAAQGYEKCRILTYSQLLGSSMDIDYNFTQTVNKVTKNIHYQYPTMRQSMGIRLRRTFREHLIGCDPAPGSKCYWSYPEWVTVEDVCTTSTVRPAYKI
ncbi:DNRLRE domain-containing protein [Nonomuraea sp. LP-02]|uniref:LamG-like jellyroll fold domain-containing protein n=1 Tax=Nonomuraea sp. LP-02 TaxID=3097960 RepID=UPI002E33C7D2|nr:LamG-like jellyroll fold domain-containing protein [Nonomuraea sp. LP-02]MED7931479.1 DNRLRE domain-containing protein [Nonomuraea sp. LP-02]